MSSAPRMPRVPLRASPPGWGSTDSPASRRTGQLQGSSLTRESCRGWGDKRGSGPAAVSSFGPELELPGMSGMVPLRRKGRGDLPHLWTLLLWPGSLHCKGGPGLTAGTRAPRVEVVSGGSSGNCDREERNAASVRGGFQQNLLSPVMTLLPHGLSLAFFHLR